MRKALKQSGTGPGKGETRRPVSRDHRVLVNRRRPQQTPAEAAAVMAVEGIGMNAVLADSFSTKLGAVDVTELMAQLTATAGRVAGGTRQDLEAILAAQFVALNAIFTDLAVIARLNLTSNVEVFERFMRLALKSQSQCRATAESIALMQAPTVFARQANIANGPLQVNNGVARAGALEPRPIELLEAHGERMDGGAANATRASRGDQEVAAVGAVHAL